jgi:hypothetical protein
METGDFENVVFKFCCDTKYFKSRIEKLELI